jgi:hypothetical protein
MAIGSSSNKHHMLHLLQTQHIVPEALPGQALEQQMALQPQGTLLQLASATRPSTAHHKQPTLALLACSMTSKATTLSTSSSSSSGSSRHSTAMTAGSSLSSSSSSTVTSHISQHLITPTMQHNNSSSSSSTMQVSLASQRFLAGS